MQRASSFPMVCRQLKGLLAARLDDEIVRYGGPGKFGGRDLILLGEVEDGTHTVVTAKAGRKTRDEDYLLVLNIHSTRGGGDPLESWERAYELMEVVEDVVAEDVTIGLRAEHPTLRVTFAEFDSGSDMDDNGWKTIIVLKLRVKIRLV
jgi:hypothetical protein